MPTLGEVILKIVAADREFQETVGRVDKTMNNCGRRMQQISRLGRMMFAGGMVGFSTLSYQLEQIGGKADKGMLRILPSLTRAITYFSVMGVNPLTVALFAAGAAFSYMGARAEAVRERLRKVQEYVEQTTRSIQEMAMPEKRMPGLEEYYKHEADALKQVLALKKAADSAEKAGMGEVNAYRLRLWQARLEQYTRERIEAEETLRTEEDHAERVEKFRERESRFLEVRNRALEEYQKQEEETDKAVERRKTEIEERLKAGRIPEFRARFEGLTEQYRRIQEAAASVGAGADYEAQTARNTALTAKEVALLTTELKQLNDYLRQQGKVATASVWGE